MTDTHQPQAASDVSNPAAPTESITLETLFSGPSTGQTSEAEIAACYRLILGREPDPEGLASFLNAVKHGMQRGRVVLSFVHSNEFRSQVDPALRAHVMAVFTAINGEQTGIKAINWFHCIQLPDGRITDGMRAHDALMREAEVILSIPLEGKSLLDIGAWDGFFTFEAEKRGAGPILSVDHHCWSGPEWGTKAGYDFAHAAFASKARSKDVDLVDLDPNVEGTFDVVLFLGVLYHLEDPYGGLKRAAAMARETLVIETVTACNTFDQPVLRHFEGNSLNYDPTNFFAPNTACLRSMLTELGFSRIEITRNPGIPVDEAELAAQGGVRERDRHIVHAWR
ncbi:MAG: DUF4214 domain-containing protein [Pseudomonadota bacterium]